MPTQYYASRDKVSSRHPHACLFSPTTSLFHAKMWLEAMPGFGLHDLERVAN
jgi:hypothetical protein